MKRSLILACLLALAGGAQAGVMTDLKNWFMASAEKDHMAETVVITPGYKMLIGGKSAPVFGNQLCPRADGIRVWFFGGDPQGGSGCMVIEKDTASVQAQFILDGKKVAEVWTVERRAPDKALLRRPNGDYLAQAN